MKMALPGLQDFDPRITVLSFSSERELARSGAKPYDGSPPWDPCDGSSHHPAIRVVRTLCRRPGDRSWGDGHGVSRPGPEARARGRAQGPRSRAEPVAWSSAVPARDQADRP